MLAAIEHLSHGALRIAGARSFHVATSIGRVHVYELRGKGHGTYVFFHGIGTSSTSYLQVALMLARHVGRVIMLDFPGHGRSDVPRDGLDRERLGAAVREGLERALPANEKAIVFGTSLGGATAIGYALEQPERVRALVLASPAGAPLGDAELDAVRARFDLRTREDARRFFSELVHAPPLYFRLLERSLVDQLGSATVQGFLRNVRASDFFTAEQLGQIHCPVHVLWGRSDRILPRSSLAFLRDALPQGTRFDEPYALGHSPHLERPGLLVKALLAARG